MREENKGRVHSSESVLITPWFSVRKDDVELPNTSRVGHYVIAFRPACSVLAVNDQGQVLLIRQYRHPIGDFMWELPAGVQNEGESPEECALRELREEAGYEASTVTPLLRDYYQLCSVANPKMSIFMAEGLTRASQKLERSEAIREVRFFDIEAIHRGVLAGDFKNAFTIIGILLAEERIARK